MIMVYSMQGDAMYINPDMIETIRVTPDTVLFLNNGKRVIIKDTPEELIDRIVEYRKRIYGQHFYPESLVQRPAD